MKIYFTAPLHQLDRYSIYYKKIIGTLEELGHEVIHDIFSYNIDNVLTQTQKELNVYYKKWYKYLEEMDVCVADISFPSTVNIGFEIASILNRAKPVIALYREGKDPIFTSPEFSKKMIKVEYTPESVSEVLQWALEEAKQQLNRRFTFVINPEIDNFLKNNLKKKKVSCSEYIRSLIKKDMKEKK